jgi:hypothetical protein
MSETSKTLENFEGFENASEIDFFGESATDTTVDVIEEVQKDTLLPDGSIETTTDDKSKKEPGNEEPIAPEINFFGENDISSQETTTTEGHDDNQDDTVDDEPEMVSHKSTLSFLKQKGLVEFELEDGEELTEQKAEEILEDSYDDAVENRVQELMSEMPDQVKNIVSYALNGGDVNNLMSKLVTQPTVKITKDLDLDSEDNQVMVIKAAQKAKGEDDETTNAYIDFLKDSGKLKTVSEKEHDKIVAAEGKLAAAEAKRISDNKKAAKENHRKFKNELSGFINESEKAGSFTLNKKDKKSLPSYIADRNVKLADGRQVTGMQEALYNALNDKEKTVQLAKILQNDFDFSEIAKAEKTKFTKEVKRDLNRSKKIPSAKENSQNKKKQLADYF